MPRSSNPNSRTVFRCVEPFAVWNGNTMRVYGTTDEVLGDDPILASHGAHFRESADLIERATAAPGERRSVIPPTPPQNTTTSEED